MTVELIPVLEIIGGHRSEIPEPKSWPYWEHPDEWDNYNLNRLLGSGFTDLGAPYAPGSHFYRLSSITEINITKVVRQHLSDFFKGVYKRDGVSPLFGGCVLKVNDKDIFFPQCCSDLSDIAYWEHIAGKHESGYYQGHPQPYLQIGKQHILFDFKTKEFDEPFVPPVPVDEITISKDLLTEAAIKAKAELHDFAATLIKINHSNTLNVPDIDNLLIWDY
ncbi:hypothetical protein [Mucilaginibacter celer]|uniref:Uncharacterized protein n=1 Tax=Mucilaginibacter celer TaxID=2305508 RepID=A0A494VVT3_9SPHI|nr:hypothetical protein [Mucilaginibacter celer]AYL95563.1 hypothetical protein HYN43_009795 [Mucilaginibacter celer]